MVDYLLLLKGLGHEMNIFLKVCTYFIGRYCIMYMRCWFLQLFVPLLFKKSSQHFRLLLRNCKLILKMLSVTLFRDPKAAIFTLKKLHTGSSL